MQRRSTASAKVRKFTQPKLPSGLRGYKTDSDLVQLIEDMDDAGWGSAAQIRETLVKVSGGKDEHLPALRTFQDILQKHHERQGKEVWSLTDAKLGQIRPVVDVLAAILEYSDGAIDNIKRNEAEFVVKIAEAAPHLPPLATWRCAREYLRRHSERKGTKDVDAFVALFGRPTANKARAQQIYSRIRVSETILGSGIGSAEALGTPSIIPSEAEPLTLYNRIETFRPTIIIGPSKTKEESRSKDG